MNIFDIDGLRFDLMGILDYETINLVCDECHKLKEVDLTSFNTIKFKCVGKPLRSLVNSSISSFESFTPLISAYSKMTRLPVLSK